MIWLFFLILTFFLTPSLSYTEVSTISQCYDCIQNQNGVMCRDERSETLAYCCGKTETARACTGRDFCTPQLKTLSLQMTACPFVQKTCSGSV